MSSIIDGGSAFPNQPNAMDGGACGPLDPGMSLRDYFAALAMQGYLAEGRLRNETLEGNKETDISISWYEVAAMCSYRMADAMLKERSRP